MTKNSIKFIFTKTGYVDDIDVHKILVWKRESYGTKSHLNTLLDTMLMMLVDYYV